MYIESGWKVVATGLTRIRRAVRHLPVVVLKGDAVSLTMSPECRWYVAVHCRRGLAVSGYRNRMIVQVYLDPPVYFIDTRVCRDSRRKPVGTAGVHGRPKLPPAIVHRVAILSRLPINVRGNVTVSVTALSGTILGMHYGQ